LFGLESLGFLCLFEVLESISLFGVLFLSFFLL
jgi:hypothetical protein